MRARRGLWQALFGAAVAAQLVVLYWPRATDPAPGLPVDKVVHLGVFALVAWTGLRAGVPRVPLLAALLAHAGVSEVIQGTLLPYRDGDVSDALADAVGVVGAVVAMAFAGRAFARGGVAARDPAYRDPVCGEWSASRDPAYRDPVCGEWLASRDPAANQ